MKRFAKSVLWLGCLGALLMGAVPPMAAQQPPSAPREERLMTQAPLEDLLARRDPAAVAELKRRFEAAPEGIDKQKIAVVLVSREAEDDVYFDYLARRAQKAVESTMPFPYEFDGEGKSVPGQLSAELLTWASQNKLAPQAAAARAIRDLPRDVFLLALTGDPRGADILLLGLDSPNYMVVYRAAWGLAKLRMNSAVPRIVEEAELAPEEARLLIARTLVLFESPEAQAAAERLLKDKRIVEELRRNARRMLDASFSDAQR